MPKHSHSISFVNNGYPDNWGRRDATNVNGHFIVGSAFMGPTLANYTTTERGGSDAHNNMPPYYVLAYIMRIN